MIHYPIPLHKQRIFSNPKIELKNSEIICDRILSLPMHPYLLDKQVDKICDILLGIKYVLPSHTQISITACRSQQQQYYIKNESYL